METFFRATLNNGGPQRKNSMGSFPCIAWSRLFWIVHPGLHLNELCYLKINLNYILFVLCFIDIDFEEEYQSSQDIPNLHFPVVQADITECATYAVVSRLHLSPEFTITSNGGSFVMPGYPSVSVTIPKKAVTSKTRIPLRLKVQNFPEI